MPDEPNPPAPPAPPSGTDSQTPPATPPADPAATATPDTTDSTKATPPAKVVPEKYDLKLPEGSLLDASLMEKATASYKAWGFSNEEAQKALERDHGLISAYAENQKKQAEEMQGAWEKEVKADKEIGGDALPKNLEMAKRFVAKFADDALKKDLDSTKLGNHPGLIRMLVRASKSMSEDQLVLPGTQAGGKKSMEEVFYGGTEAK